MVEYEKKSSGKTELKEFLHVSTNIKTDYVKEWTADLLKERDQFWQSVGATETHG